ncbi:hypothetical protein WICMUC_003403 [Wickerhamomyces mucosus]|uniref:Ceramide synthase subunit LIP1 n=1 Tax=Wickerhamomyces mucosus TaxID=1378264 RepID=A0A9P8TDI6_9ASCO|nr:hypothetical protein WICMUC_003403 [Wickerhamomyces mucosus]
MTQRFAKLFKYIAILAVLMAAVEYFKYGTMTNYEWFHCTVSSTGIPNTSIKEFKAVGGPSCDKRGQLKSIVKKISREFDPNYRDVLFCIKDAGNKVIGYGSEIQDEALLKEHCENIIHW